MASETGIDVVYRTALTSFGVPMVKTLNAVSLDGFTFTDEADATSNAVEIKIYAFDNTVAGRTILDAPIEVAYTDHVFRPHTTVWPRAHGKSFVVEFNCGINETAPDRGLIDFFGNMYGKVSVYDREPGGL